MVYRMTDKSLPLVEDIDFHYLLGLLPPLENIPEFAWLPELFSIIGAESLITLSKYAGGETIKIPTIAQLSNSILALQYFYDCYISNKIQTSEIPDSMHSTVAKIKEVYDA